MDSSQTPVFTGAGWNGSADHESVFVLVPGASSGVWIADEVAVTTTYFASFTFEQSPNTKPGLAYMQNGEPIVCWSDKGVRCATKVGGVWTQQTITSGLDEMGETEVRVAPDGCCHIAFRTGTGVVRHATDCP
jgi:hypothetical protein